jgi:predicted nucleic acid-binding protein
MSVLVDTPIWSMFFRREGARNRERGMLRDLVEQRQARIIGSIRQEILSGMRSPEQFARVRDGLRAFPDIPVNETDFERAAEFYNHCRLRGVQGSNTDFLICAVAELNELKIFTTDRDFERFAKFLPIELF